MDAWRRFLIFSLFPVAILAFLPIFLIPTGIGNGATTAALAAYDAAQRVRSVARLGVAADPFIVVVVDSIAGGPDRAETLRALHAAGVRGVFLSDLRLGSGVPASEAAETAEAELLVSFQIAVAGGFCIPVGDLRDAPAIAISGEAPPNLPAAVGYLGPSGAYKTLPSGHLNVFADVDGIVRRVPLAYRTELGVVPAAPLVFLAAHLGVPLAGLRWIEGHGRLGFRALAVGEETIIPVDDCGAALLDFPLSWPGTFASYQARDLAAAADDPSAIAALRQEAKDALFFFVDSGPGAASGAVSSSSLFPFAALAPLLVNQVCSGTGPEELPPGTTVASLFLVATIAAAAAIVAEGRPADARGVRRPGLSAWIVPLCGTALVWGASVGLFAGIGLYLDPVPALASTLLLAVRGGVLHALHAVRERERIAADRERVRVFAEIGRSAAGLTHGLRGRIALAANVAQLLQEESLSQRGACTLDLLLRSIDDLSRSIEASLEIVRAGGSGKGIERVDAAALLRGFYLLVAGPTPGVRATLDIRREPAFVGARREELRQILEILFKNAVESSSSEGASEGRGTPGPIQEIAIVLETEGAFVAIEVNDRGKGIAACFDCREPDCRICGKITLGSTTKRDGTGYGLYWARTILARNGGALRIRSSPAGTSARILWPLG